MFCDDRSEYNGKLRKAADPCYGCGRAGHVFRVSEQRGDWLCVLRFLTTLHVLGHAVPYRTSSRELLL